MPVKTIYGRINKDGSLADGSSPELFGAQHNGEEDSGQYSVSIKDGVFDGAPVVVATVMTGDQSCTNGTNRTISVTGVTETQLCFGIRKASAGNESSDRDFAFQAIGTSP